MQIQINPGDVPTSDAIDQHIRDEVEKAMRLISHQVTRVEVHLHDENAQKGGLDKRCVMEARLAGLKPIAVQDEGNDLYLTIKQAAEKLQRAVRNRLDRHEAHKSS
jgi:ribosomal subunit interface protein